MPHINTNNYISKNNIPLTMNFITTFKDLLVESLKEHKNLIIILYALLIITFIIAWIYVSGSTGEIMQNIQGAKTTSPSPVNTLGDNPLDLFINNAGGGIITYLASIFFGIFAVATILYNGFNLGALGPVLGTYMAHGGLQYIIYLIPHGIFELTGTVIQSTAGIVLFQFVWRFLKNIIRGDNGTRLSVNESFEKNKKVLIQSLVLLIFATILMLIAAPIEAYFSVPFSKWILGA